MISVSIAINGEPIFARSATNQGDKKSGFTKYLVDDGSTILHKRSAGAVCLAIMMLNTIKEQGVKNVIESHPGKRVTPKGSCTTVQQD